MKIGDLAMTQKGNLCVISEIGYGKDGRIGWYNIVFCSSGFLRTGFPPEWLRRYEPK